MTQPRPKLSQLKRVCPQDLARCEGYVWHLGTKIGKGSFGEVYLGWTNDGNTEVAVKVVRKEYFKQDPKVRENLEREIRILKLLRGCEYVVQILHVQEMKHFIVLVMELCDYDLDHLVKIEPFNEEDIINFLYQLAQGMKALRNQNIVHRDLKPGNILITRHRTSGSMMIKLADFGFARHFKDEGNKIIDMTSLAGTPVFMAPEALSCVFHPGEHYDDKVDIWSIGALLYKVIVGQCGFYAQLQDIPRILRHKGDAIAFERTSGRKINYVYELPSSVNDRLSEPFREKMKTLLCLMLKLDPRERMTFSEFFETVDDIICSKVEIINLLHGTSLKIIYDPSLTVPMLIEKVHIQWHVPPTGQVIFSTSCQYCIAPHENISQAQFVELLEKSGGSKGHAKLYFLPIHQLNVDHVPPDQTCFTPLKYTVDDQDTIVNLITEQKFTDEIVHMIGNMGSQQRKQLEGLEELVQFTSAQIQIFETEMYSTLLQHAYQALAKASLASQWLNEDIATLGKDQTQLSSIVASLQTNENQLQQLLQELSTFRTKPAPLLTESLSKEEISKEIASLSERAKKLPKARKDLIQSLCKGISEDCVKEISRITQIIKDQLVPFNNALKDVWSLKIRSSVVLDVCKAVDQLLGQVSQERNLVLKSLSSGTNIQDRKVQAANPLPVVTPPPVGWPQHGVGGSFFPPPGQWTDPAIVDNLKKQMETLRSQLASKNDENQRLILEVSTLKTQATGDDVQSTLVPSKAANIRESGSEDNVKLMEGLSEQLQHFCSVANKLNPETLAVTPGASGSSPLLYPPLDYSFISMPDSKDCYNLHELIPMAQRLSDSVNCNISSMESVLKSTAKGNSTITPNSALVKIGRPSEYDRGDIVMFTGVRTVRSNSTVPALFHLQQNKPYVLLDASCYSHFNIRPGKTEMVLARLTNKPSKMKFEDNRDIASDLGVKGGEFYQVHAEPLPLKFSVPPDKIVINGPPKRQKSPHPHTPTFFKVFHKEPKDYV